MNAGSFRYDPASAIRSFCFYITARMSKARRSILHIKSASSWLRSYGTHSGRTTLKICGEARTCTDDGLYLLIPLPKIFSESSLILLYNFFTPSEWVWTSWTLGSANMHIILIVDAVPWYVRLSSSLLWSRLSMWQLVCRDTNFICVN